MADTTYHMRIGAGMNHKVAKAVDCNIGLFEERFRGGMDSKRSRNKHISSSHE